MWCGFDWTQTFHVVLFCFFAAGFVTLLIYFNAVACAVFIIMLTCGYVLCKRAGERCNLAWRRNRQRSRARRITTGSDDDNDDNPSTSTRRRRRIFNPRTQEHQEMVILSASSNPDSATGQAEGNTTDASPSDPALILPSACPQVNA